MTRVTLGKSRVRESCTPGSVRAKAEWLSYSTVTPPVHSVNSPGRNSSRFAVLSIAYGFDCYYPRAVHHGRDQSPACFAGESELRFLAICHLFVILTWACRVMPDRG